MRRSISEEDARRKWPLLQYASWHWIKFLVDSLTGSHREIIIAVIQSAVNLLESGLSLMTWVESLYTFPVDSFAGQLERLKEICQAAPIFSGFSDTDPGRLCAAMLELTTDVLEVHQEWGKILLTNPCEIWVDVAIFSNSRFFVNTKAGSAKSMAPKLIDLATSETQSPLFSVSRHSADSKTLAVLGIFPNS